MPPIDELTRIEPAHLDRLDHQGIDLTVPGEAPTSVVIELENIRAARLYIDFEAPTVN